VPAVEDVAGHHIPHGSPDINVDNLQRDTYSDHGLLGGIQIGIGRHMPANFDRQFGLST
jgi:hypothetical protein